MSGQDYIKKYYIDSSKNNSKDFNKKTVYFLELDKFHDIGSYYESVNSYYYRIDRKTYESFVNKIHIFKESETKEDIIKCFQLDHLLI